MTPCPTEADSLKVAEADFQEWHSFLECTPGGSYQQTSWWSIAKLMTGFRGRRFVIKRGTVTVGGAQMLYRPLPLVGAVAYVPLGPVLASDDPEVAELALSHLHRIAREQNVSFLAVQAPRWNKSFALKLRNRGFSLAFQDLAPNASAVIDLSNSVESILSRMRKTTRYDIRAAQRKGIAVREGGPEDLDGFYELLLATSRRQGFTTLKKNYLVEVWRQFSRDQHIKMFIAEFEGKPVSAALMMAFGDTVTYWKGGWSGNHAGRYPNEALQWAAIQWAKAHGHRYYDFGGINRAVAKSALAREPMTKSTGHSVSFYKLGFGGQVELFPEALLYVYNPMVRRVRCAMFTRDWEQELVRNILDRIRK
jgi:peptidoglycan pentaglycine glycine transferase (the first glycine)